MKKLFSFLNSNTHPHFSHGFDSFLEKRLAFEDATPPEGGKTETPPADSKGDDKTPPSDPTKGDDDKGKSKPSNSAEARIAEKTAETKAAIERAEKAEAKLEEAEKTKKEEKGAFKDLYEEEKEATKNLKTQLEAETQKTEALETSVTKLVENQMEAIPEDKREFAEKLLEGKSSDQKLELMPDLLKQFGVTEGVKGFGAGLPGGTGTPPNGDPDLADKKARMKDLTTKASAGTLAPSERLELQNLSTSISNAMQKGKGTGGIEYDRHTGLPKTA